MQIGLVGLPLVGKTTFFNLLTGAGAPVASFLGASTEVHTASAVVPDERVDFLSKLYKPRKTIYARIQFKDIPGVHSEGMTRAMAAKLLEEVRSAEVLVHVVRAFENKDVSHVLESIDPYRDARDFMDELLLADMELVEKRIERIKGGKKIKKEQQAELGILERYLEALESEQPLSSLNLSDEERRIMVNYNFLTEKPVILAVNVDENQFRNGYPGKEEIADFAREKQMPVVEICAQIEAEINELPEEDRKEFMQDLGIKESGIARLARAAYDCLGLISFFTVGEDEVRAWTVRKGATAPEAAGKIHSDLERGFIRAEVFNYEDLRELGSPAKVKEKGLLRVEGKDYVVRDGDIINVRFNV